MKHNDVLRRKKFCFVDTKREKKLRENRVHGGNFEITSLPRVRHLGIQHRFYSKEEIVF